MSTALADIGAEWEAYVHRPEPIEWNGTWHIVRVQSGRERLARELIELWGYTAKFPMITAQRRHRVGSLRKRITYRKPAVAGYLCVKADRPLWPLLWHPSVLGVVMDDDDYAAVSDAALQRFEATVIEKRDRIEFVEIKAGKKAVVVVGPLSGQEVDVEEIDGEIAQVLALMFGEKRRLRLRVANLAPV